MRGLCLLLVGCALAHAEPFVLVTGGRPAATVVLPDKAPERLTAAAADLRRYVARRSGCELPLRTDGQAVTGPAIYLGRCATTTEADLPAADANPESFRVTLRAGSLHLAGRYPTASAFAVWSLLEQELGIRWFAPGELWEFVPPATPGELQLDVRPRTSVPSTSPRVWSGHAWVDSWKQWNLRNKTVLNEVVPRRQFQNNMHRVITPEKYGQTHPEYFPLIQGKRWIPPAGNDYWRPCESNPDVQRLVVAAALKFFADHPDNDSFSLGMDDISHFCGCPACRAMDAHPDDYEHQRFSDRHYKFVNAIAREVAKVRPDRFIGTLIYSVARPLPETVERLEPNVFGYLTETSAAWWDEARHREDQELTRAWAQRCRHLSRYDYYGFASLTPRYYPHHMAEQLKLDKSLGLEGMYIETYTFLPHTAPMIWACARLQWDISQDVDALLAEFNQRMYGAAAGTMQRYYDLLERSYNEVRPGRGAWEHRNLLNQALAMSPAAVDQGFALLAQALREADSDPARQRLQLVRDALTYSSYPIHELALSRALLADAVSDAAGAEVALTRLTTLLRLSAEREACWAAAPRRQDLLGETVRGLGDYLALGQVSRLESGATVGAMRLLGWAEQQPPAVRGDLAERLRRLPGGTLADAARAWLWVIEHQPPNLVKNGDFETAGPGAAPAEQDWQAGAAAGWSTWTGEGHLDFVVRPKLGLKDSRAALIAGQGRGVWLQNVPVQPGDRCLVRAQLRRTGAVTGNATLSLRFRTAQGAWHPRRDLEPTVDHSAGPGVWQPVVLYVVVPPGAGALTVMLGATNPEPGDEVRFDDVAVYRLPAQP